MRLSVKSASVSDLQRAKSLYGPDKGDLSAAACLMCFPLDIATSDMSTQQLRAEWSVQQQIDLVERDPTVHPIMVVDEDADAGAEIVSFGRWHYYPNGYQHMGDLEFSGAKDRNEASWPEGLQKELYVQLLDAAFAARRGWMKPESGPYWVLTNIVTREPLRKNGAGSIILRWGLDKAKSDGVPAYLEAAPAAKSLYEKHGFKPVGKTEVKVGELEIEFCNMRADP